ncbi:MAG: hypothetical protein AB7F96_22185 [Beijerinckiaceae bacterium]
MIEYRKSGASPTQVRPMFLDRHKVAKEALAKAEAKAKARKKTVAKRSRGK